MTPREIDALVAENVMGWKAAGGPWWEDSSGEAVAPRKEGALDCGEEVDPWSPSTDIAAAWEVVLKLKEKFRWIDLQHDSKGFSCSIESHVYVEGNLMPMAICLAALKAVGVELEAPILK